MTDPAAEPIGPEPIGPEPIGPEPIGTEPIGPEPTSPEPISPGPIGTGPIGTEPAVTEPISHPHAFVQFFPSVSAFGGNSAALVEVLPAGTVRLSLLEAASHPSEILFDVAPAAIERVFITRDATVFTVGSHKFRTRAARSSGMKSVLDVLRAAGTPVRRWSAGSNFVAGILIASAVLIVVIVGVLAASPS